MRTAAISLAVSVTGLVLLVNTDAFVHPGSSKRAAPTASSSSSFAGLGMSSTAASPPPPAVAVPGITNGNDGNDGNNFLDSPVSDRDEITSDDPLRVVIAGGGVGGLALAKALSKNPRMRVTVLEQTSQFRRFGGPIQLASNAMQILQEMDGDVYGRIMDKFTYTGDKTNGIKDGIRTEWYAKFDLKTPAEHRNMPYTGVIERPDLQEIYLDALPEGTVVNGNAVAGYKIVPSSKKKSSSSSSSSSPTTTTRRGGDAVRVTLDSGREIQADVLIGADGIWSAVRSAMHKNDKKGENSGASYSGYTVFAGELKYDSPDNGEVGYKVYIGPSQYFVITDIGKGNYQWYAFLARPPDSAKTVEMPEGSSAYLRETFRGWSPEVHAILRATREHEIEQRDLYDRPPSVGKPWTDGPVALLGDGIHAMMPNLGQGGCQAIEDAYVIAQELDGIRSRSEIAGGLSRYADRRLIRSAAVQGLSRFASDIIIRGFDTPAKIVKNDDGGGWGYRFENFNYAGIVTRMMQPILPIFFTVQFSFLYDGWRNENKIDVKSTVGFLLVGGLILALTLGALEEAGLLAGFGLEALIGGEVAFDFEAVSQAVRELFTIAS